MPFGIRTAGAFLKKGAEKGLKLIGVDKEQLQQFAREKLMAGAFYLAGLVKDAISDSNEDKHDLKHYSKAELDHARAEAKALKECKPYKKFVFSKPLDTVKEKVDFILHKNPKNNNLGDVPFGSATAQNGTSTIDPFLRAADEASEPINNNTFHRFHWCTHKLISAIYYCANRCPKSLRDGLEDALLCEDSEEDN